MSGWRVVSFSRLGDLERDDMFVNMSPLEFPRSGVCVKMSLSQLEMRKWNLGVSWDLGI